MIADIVRALAARLPDGWKAVSIPGTPRNGPNASLRITAPDRASATIPVELKDRLLPRGVVDVVAALAQYAPGPALVAAPFLSPRTRDQLRAANLNYIDLTGNLRLVLSRPGLFVETAGALADPRPLTVPSRSLRGPKAGRVVRALCDFRLPLSISDLGARAQVDISYASRLVEWLAQEALLERKPRGAVEAVDRPALIRRWAQDYSVLKSNDARGFLDPRGIDNLVRGLANAGTRRMVITGSLAANRIAPIAPARLAMVYVDDIAGAAKALNLVPADTGANVMLLAPFDEVVFARPTTTDGLTFVAASQLAVDLLTSPGRAPSEAEPVLQYLSSPREEDLA
ncbi:MAG: hypothetical protein NUW22_10235 [Acidobacteria bacterium]|nr:hypothetical protein [Acidobacteriota bacterium]